MMDLPEARDPRHENFAWWVLNGFDKVPARFLKPLKLWIVLWKVRIARLSDFNSS
jgi:hypothetical protein